MTRRYLLSSWCKEELQWFEAQVKESSRIGGLVLVVRAQPTEHDDWPTLLKDERGETLLGFQFHGRANSADDHIHPFGFPEPQPSDKEFFNQLAKLTSVITTRLRDIKKNRLLVNASQPRKIRPAQDGVFSVLLHPPKFAMSRLPGMKERFDAAVAAWEEARRALEYVDCNVWPKEVTEEGVKLSDINRMRSERLDFPARSRPCGLHAAPRGGPPGRKVEALASDRSALLDDGARHPTGRDRPERRRRGSR